MTTVAIPEDSPFGVENLPYGIFTPDHGRGPRRAGVRLGDMVLDLAELLGEDTFAQPTLNSFMAQGHERWVEVRERLKARAGDDLPSSAVHRIETVQLHLPIEVADYVDFYASEAHAANVGRIFRPDGDPLAPNWKHLPVGYHGRAGTVVVSGTDVVRPCGQSKAPGEPAPRYEPSSRLDFEAEVGFVVGVPSLPNEPVPCDDFAAHVFGIVLVNDWSARDIQAWESAPLGPFLGKSFATSVSPWVVPILALDAARVPTPPHDPPPLPYLREHAPWGLDITLAVRWNGEVVSRPPYRQMYWSPAQMLAHLTSNGASLRTGDLYASGTVSGPQPDQAGTLIELTGGGARPLTVAGQERTYLRDGDEVAISAMAPGPLGARIGFGDVRGRVLPARQPM